ISTTVKKSCKKNLIGTRVIMYLTGMSNNVFECQIKFWRSHSEKIYPKLPVSMKNEINNEIDLSISKVVKEILKKY
ncbi:MAG: hypothetical protein LBQ89_08875, partial [Treponema sp.]|nr:hypothetical protein [Treponema sp.]